jgi:AcrR family transcriptional regulator
VEEDPRERLIAAADRLFYGRGIQAVGMDVLRNEAGLSLKAIYRIFPSKEAILAEVLRRRNKAWMHGVLAQAATVDTPREKMLSSFDFLTRWFAQDDFRGCAFINSFGELGAISPEVAQAARHHKEAFADYLADLARDAGAPDYLAPQLALLVEGAQTTAAILADKAAASNGRAAAATLIDASLARAPGA